ncbi:MAG: hypothetical protein WBC55_09915 [Dehalococcoidia bacterium]
MATKRVSTLRGRQVGPFYGLRYFARSRPTAQAQSERTEYVRLAKQGSLEHLLQARLEPFSGRAPTYPFGGLSDLWEQNYI